MILLLSSLPFAGIGAAFALAPERMASLVGVGLEGPLADNDLRAVYGGLQLGCGAFLALCAARPAWVEPGLYAQALLFGGLALARLLSLALVGSPGGLGLMLHFAELLGAGVAVLALSRLRR